MTSWHIFLGYFLAMFAAATEVHNALPDTYAGKWDCYNVADEMRSYKGNGSVACIPDYGPCYSCMNWSDVPDELFYGTFALSADEVAELDLEENFCRFIGPDSTTPQCVINQVEHNTTYFISCSIPPCDAHAGCMFGNGTEYRDMAMFTETGHRCLYWSDVGEQPVNLSTHPNAGLTNNFCRNPDNKERPWCYFYDDSSVSWDFCPIPQCQDNTLSNFSRLLGTTINYRLWPYNEYKGSDIVTVEECALNCLQETSFKCRSFIFNEFMKYIPPFMSAAQNDQRPVCIWTNVSIYTLDNYREPKRDEQFDLFTRIDAICDAYEPTEYPDLCPLPLGMASGVIADAQITASSYLDAEHMPHFARLGNSSSWMPALNDPQPHIEIVFPSRMIFTGLIVQGEGVNDGAFVESFYVLYRNDDSLDNLWWFIMDFSHLEITDVLFRGNGEPHCERPVYFDAPIRAAQLRIIPFEKYKNISMRLEVLGCRDDDCDFTLGMQNGRIHDSRITASSSLSEVLYGPPQSRLRPYGQQKDGNGWMPSYHSNSRLADYDTPTLPEVKEWIQVDLRTSYLIKAVLTQGCGRRWVTAFTLLYSTSKQQFRSYKLGNETRIFLANTDNNTVVRNNLEKPTVAQTVRLVVQYSHNGICLRFELVGCKHRVCGNRIGMESRFIADRQITSAVEEWFGPPAAGRLHFPRGCWIPSSWGDHHWIEVQLLGLYTITGVITQGGYDDWTREYMWGEYYRLLYLSKDEQEWRVYTDRAGNHMDFPMYPDPHTEMRHDLERPFITSAVRLNPRSSRGQFCVRLELLGCRLVEYGQICGETSVAHDGFCLSTVNNQKVDSCDNIFMEGSYPIAISSQKTQDFLEKNRTKFELPYRYQYVIGLRMLQSQGQHSFTWRDGTPSTFQNFRWTPDQVDVNSTEDWCVSFDMDDGMKWRAYKCRDDLISRATVCQIDVDECLTRDNGCSHRCQNVEGSFHCMCPRGYHLESLNGSTCTSVCQSKFHYLAEANLTQNGTVCEFHADFERSPFSNTTSALECRPRQSLTTFPEDSGVSFNGRVVLSRHRNKRNQLGHHHRWPRWVMPWSTPSSSPDPTPWYMEEESSAICSTEFASLRCEELWESHQSVVETSLTFGLVESVSFPPWYNTGQWCQMRIHVPEGQIIRFFFHEMTLRRSSHSAAICIDTLNITDRIPNKGQLLRGSYCGHFRDLKVKSRSNDVTLRLEMGALEADMPKKLGFIATYDTLDCSQSHEECDPGCGRQDPFTAPRGNFSLDNLGRSSVQPFSACTWTITLPEGKFIFLNFTEFDVERDADSGACVDSVEIVPTSRRWDEGRSRHLLCGTRAGYVMTNVSSVTLIFQTGLDSESHGFHVVYSSQAVPGCKVGNYESTTEEIVCNYDSAAVASPNYPLPYQPNARPRWRITTRHGTFIQLRFEDFEIGSPGLRCEGDTLSIHDGATEMTPLIGTYCNSLPPPEVVVASFNSMYIKLRSLGSGTGRGFYAVYRGTTFQETLEDGPTTPIVAPGKGMREKNRPLPETRMCPPGWELYAESCYALRQTESGVRWTDANRMCRDEGAHLVSIANEDEMRFVHILLTSTWFRDNLRTFIGLTYEREKRLHRWVDDSPLSYADWFIPDRNSDWGLRQPNGGDLEECALINLHNLHSMSQWHDVPCASKSAMQLVCEKAAHTATGLRKISRQRVGPFSQKACDQPWDLIGSSCVRLISLQPARHASNVTSQSSCPPGSSKLQFMTIPLSRQLTFYADHLWPSARDFDTILVEDAKSRSCQVLVKEQVDGRVKFQMKLIDCSSNMGAVICSKPAVENPSTCLAHMFQCGSGECVHNVYVCDRHTDCTDGSDESPELCPPPGKVLTQVTTVTSSPLTIQSDTEELPVCRSNFFRCKSGECISVSFFCDFIKHCADGSDEECEYPTCSEDSFSCDNGQCIPISQRCDLLPQCIDGSDEIACQSSNVGFQCYDSTWFPLRILCDGVKDCPGNSWEDEPNYCRFNLSSFECAAEFQIQCRNGACADRSTTCLYDFDEYGLQIGCRDVTHLRHCELFECGSSTFKCPNTYCIPLKRRCDGTRDCPTGEDELGCDNYTCPSGTYRCRGEMFCLTPSEVCDGIKQCPQGDDEFFCGEACPSGCLCSGLAYTCSSSAVWSSTAASLISTNTRILNLSSVMSRSYREKRSIQGNLTLEDALHIDLHDFRLLAELDVSNNEIEIVHPGTFSTLINLYKLIMAENNIKFLQNRTFEGLVRLVHLDLSGNPLHLISPGAFASLRALPTLNLSSLDLNTLKPRTFGGLTSVKHISLRNNPLYKVETGVFHSLNMTETLDIRGCDVTSFHRDVFNGLVELNTLYTDDFVFCCLVHDSTHCEAPIDQFSNCQDLMRNKFLRVAIWLLGLSALVGNAFVMVWRWRTRHKEPTKRVQTFLILNLALSDLLMGLYMIIIGSADMYYREEYMIHKEKWQSSPLCQMAGFLSVLSAEASVFLVTLISIDRFLGVVFPFSRFRFHTKSVRVNVFIAWLLAFILSLLPLTLKSAFGDRFYGRSSVCLALPLTADRPRGWGYSVAVFIGFNFVSFFIIFCCYTAMFIAIRRASQQCTRQRERSEEVKMATKMAVIVGTDFCCWMPIIVMALLSLSKAVEIPQEMYAWVAVFILPVNSAANPYLYTISTLERSREKSKGTPPTHSTWKSECTRELSVGDLEMVRFVRRDSGAPKGAVRTTSDLASPFVRSINLDLSENRVMPVVSSRCRTFTLAHYLSTPSLYLSEVDVMVIERDVGRALEFLHRNGYVHGRVTEDYILVDKDIRNNRTGAFLIMRGEELEPVENGFIDSENEDAIDNLSKTGLEVADEDDEDDEDDDEEEEEEECLPLLQRDYQQLRTLVLRLKSAIYP
ncbi:uncharacterized protein [Diadema setosum]|uniref:uncharacterized protein n=1 Tax=Diadema setosum TaxID=31175 RepID=UPI003B3BD7C2